MRKKITFEDNAVRFEEVNSTMKESKDKRL